METNNNQQTEEQIIEAPLSADQEKELVKNELALIPEADRNDILKVVKTSDIVLIDSHKKKLKSFKARFPPKKYEIKEGLVFDKAIYDKLLEQWRELKNYRTKNVEPDFKKLKAPYVALTKFYNDTCTPVVTDFKALEKPISDLIDKLEELEKEEKEKEARLLEVRTNERVNILIRSGAIFDGSYYFVGSEQFNVPAISLGIVDIQTMTDGIFENVLGQVIEKASFIAEETEKENVRIAEEKKIEAENKRLAEEKLAEDQRKLVDQQKQQEEERLQLRNDRIAMRGEQLEMIGMECTEGNEYRLGAFKISFDKIADTPASDWSKMITDIKLSIAENKKKAEEQQKDIQRQAKIATIVDARKKQVAAIGLVLNPHECWYEYKNLRVIEEQFILDTSEENDWDKKFYTAINLTNDLKQEAQQKEAEAKKIADNAIADKALADKKAADELAEKNRIEALNKQGDSALWSDFISRLKAISFPEVKSNDFQIKVASVRSFIEGLK